MKFHSIYFFKLFAALAFLVMLSGISYADMPVMGGTLYLVDSPGGSGTADANLSKLYKVTLSGTTASLTDGTLLKQESTRLVAVTTMGYAVESRENRLYFIDYYKPGSLTVSGNPLNTGIMGYSVLDASGKLGNPTIGAAVFYSGSVLPEVTGGAFSAMDGKFYVFSQLNDSLFTVDLSTYAATLVGVIKNTVPITDITINLNAGDIAFDPTTHELYLWTNLGRGTQARKGLYKLTLPASDGVVSATYIGQPALGDWATVTGLIIDSDGTMYASTAAAGTTPSRIVVVNKTTGAFGAKYDMEMGTSDFTHFYGDLAIFPTPLPPTVLLLGSGLLGLMGWRRFRKG